MFEGRPFQVAEAAAAEASCQCAGDDKVAVISRPQSWSCCHRVHWSDRRSDCKCRKMFTFPCPTPRRPEQLAQIGMTKNCVTVNTAGYMTFYLLTRKSRTCMRLWETSRTESLSAPENAAAVSSVSMLVDRLSEVSWDRRIPRSPGRRLM